MHNKLTNKYYKITKMYDQLTENVNKLYSPHEIICLSNSNVVSLLITFASYTTSYYFTKNTPVSVLMFTFAIWFIYFNQIKISSKFECLKSLKQNDKYIECSICLNFTDTMSIVTKCGHIYHYRCIMKWLNYQKCCPICRAIIN